MRRQQGFLLMERLLVLVLTAVMLAAALPAWRGWQEGTRAREWGQRMQLALADLRRQAMREQRELTLCGSRDGQSCAATGVLRWLAFHDRDGDGRRQPDEEGWNWLPVTPDGWHVVWRSFRNQPQMIWLASGDAAFSNGTLTLCPPAAHDAALRQLVISRSGRVRLVQPVRAGATTLRAARAACGWP